MNLRVVFSMVLISLGLILAFLPSPGTQRFIVAPPTLLRNLTSENTSFTTDQVARFVADQDSTVLLIDLRSPGEYDQVNIPGSVNIPYPQLLDKNKHLGTYFSHPATKIIFYSNGDMDSGYALAIARGLGYNNAYLMQGGLNQWFLSVMNSVFSGERISARENALFEARTKAKNYFTKMNSLPDSLKIRFAQKSKFDPKKLDGGCE